MARSGNSEDIDSDQSSYYLAFTSFPLIKSLHLVFTYIPSLTSEFIIGTLDISEIGVLLLILLVMLD